MRQLFATDRRWSFYTKRLVELYKTFCANSAKLYEDSGAHRAKAHIIFGWFSFCVEVVRAEARRQVAMGVGLLLDSSGLLCFEVEFCVDRRNELGFDSIPLQYLRSRVGNSNPWKRRRWLRVQLCRTF